MTPPAQSGSLFRFRIKARIHTRIIVTANLKDLLDDSLSQYDIEAQQPDPFINYLLEFNVGEVIQAFQSQVANLKKPPKTAEEVLGILQKSGLGRTVNSLLNRVVSPRSPNKQ